MWDEVGARVEQHREAFGITDSRNLLGRRPQWHDGAYAASHRAPTEACERLGQALGRDIGIEPMCFTGHLSPSVEQASRVDPTTIAAKRRSKPEFAHQPYSGPFIRRPFTMWSTGYEEAMREQPALQATIGRGVVKAWPEPP